MPLDHATTVDRITRLSLGYMDTTFEFHPSSAMHRMDNQSKGITTSNPLSRRTHSRAWTPSGIRIPTTVIIPILILLATLLSRTGTHMVALMTAIHHKALTMATPKGIRLEVQEMSASGTPCPWSVSDRLHRCQLYALLDLPGSADGLSSSCRRLRYSSTGCGVPGNHSLLRNVLLCEASCKTPEQASAI